MKTLKRAVELSHQIIGSVLCDGDIAIDCTAGNGNDTVFLANLVGKCGKVYGFDVQEIAINNTNQKLKENGLENRAELVSDSHENVDKYVHDKINAAVYNLGYLPGGDHNVVTQPDSTVISLEKILNLLQFGGIVTIAIYYGHQGGPEEKDAVIDFVSKLDQDIYAVQKIQFLNFKNEPPILICIERIG